MQNNWFQLNHLKKSGNRFSWSLIMAMNNKDLIVRYWRLYRYLTNRLLIRLIIGYFFFQSCNSTLKYFD